MADDKKNDLLGNTGVAGLTPIIDAKAFAAQTAPVPGMIADPKPTQQLSPDPAVEAKRRADFDAWKKRQDDEAKAERDKAAAESKARADREAEDKAKAESDAKAKADADAKAKADAAKVDADAEKVKAGDDQTEAKRGPVRPPKKPPYEGEDVTYTPGKGDPETTTWRGMEFTAGKPVRVKDMTHIDAIRANKFFKIGDGKSESELDKDPEDATEYRAHVWRWINGPGMTRIDAICAKWSSESELRKKCEVSGDDVKMLGTLIEPKMKSLRMAEGLTDMQVAQLWVAHGTLDLPWRAS